MKDLKGSMKDLKDLKVLVLQGLKKDRLKSVNKHFCYDTVRKVLHHREQEKKQGSIYKGSIRTSGC